VIRVRPIEMRRSDAAYTYTVATRTAHDRPRLSLSLTRH